MPRTNIGGAFFGRSAELEALERRYASPRSELIPVYGRRRVGKTEFPRPRPGTRSLLSGLQADPEDSEVNSEFSW